MDELHLDKDIQKFVDKLKEQGGKPLYEQTPEQARRTLEIVQSGNVNIPAVDWEKVVLPLPSGSSMKTIFVRPLKAKNNLPILFYLHGGGWVMGNEQTHRRLICELADKTRMCVVFPVYENAPQGQYPRVTKDLFETLEYVCAHAKQYALNADKLVVAGDSVGGLMAAVMTMMAKEQNNRPRILYQVLLYPVTNANFNTASYEAFEDGPWLTREAMKWFWDMYVPDGKSRNEKYAAPLRASDDDLKGLPPALVVTDENDVLRSEGEAYARRLNEAGVDVAGVRFNGAIHDFLMLNDISQSAPARMALELVCTVLKNILK